MLLEGIALEATNSFALAAPSERLARVVNMCSKRNGGAAIRTSGNPAAGKLVCPIRESPLKAGRLFESSSEKEIEMNENMQKALKCARGSFQRDLVTGQCSLSLRELRGRAASFRGHYAKSRDNLLLRLKKAGVPFEVNRGPRGGMWSAKLIIK